jgi:hypothetical protein
VNSLRSLEPEDAPITNTIFRLCRLAFHTVVREGLGLINGGYCLSIAPSAVVFLQRIMEDFYFGTVLRPFRVVWHHAAPAFTNRTRYSSPCIVSLGDTHGTTMFCLDECGQRDDDDDGENQNDGDMSDPDDADYDPDLSDMDECNGDDDDSETSDSDSDTSDSDDTPDSASDYYTALSDMGDDDSDEDDATSL